jgi:hypothetical protein
MKFNYYVSTKVSSHHPYPRVSWRFELVYTFKRKPDNMMQARPPRPHMRPQFATMIKESSQVPPFPSACLPCNTTLGDIHKWLVQYPDIHPCRRGEVSSNLATAKATKFAGPHKSCIHQYIFNASQGPMRHGP